MFNGDKFMKENEIEESIDKREDGSKGDVKEVDSNEIVNNELDNGSDNVALKALIKKDQNIPLVERNATLEMLLQCNIIIENERNEVTVVNQVILCGKLDFISLIILRFLHHVPTTIGIIESQFSSINAARDLCLQITNELMDEVDTENQRCIVINLKEIVNMLDFSKCRLFIIPDNIFNNWLNNSVVNEDTYGLSYALYDFVNRYSSVTKDGNEQENSVSDDNTNNMSNKVNENNIDDRLEYHDNDQLATEQDDSIDVEEDYE